MERLHVFPFRRILESDRKINPAPANERCARGSFTGQFTPPARASQRPPRSPRRVLAANKLGGLDAQCFAGQSSEFHSVTAASGARLARETRSPLARKDRSDPPQP